MNIRQQLRDMDSDSILSALGLQREQSMAWPIVGAALGGVVVGAAVALLFAPKTGREMRGDLSDYVGKKREQLMDATKSAVDSTKSSIDSAKDKVSDLSLGNTR